MYIHSLEYKTCNLFILGSDSPIGFKPAAARQPGMGKPGSMFSKGKPFGNGRRRAGSRSSRGKNAAGRGKG